MGVGVGLGEGVVVGDANSVCEVKLVGKAVGDGVEVGIVVDVALASMKFTWIGTRRDPDAGSVPSGVEVKSAKP